MARAGARRPSRKGGERRREKSPHDGKPGRRQWDRLSSLSEPQGGRRSPSRRRTLPEGSGGLESPPHDGKPGRRQWDRLSSLSEPQAGRRSPSRRRTLPEGNGGLESPPHGGRRGSPSEHGDGLESPSHGGKGRPGSPPRGRRPGAPERERRRSSGLRASRGAVELLYGRNAVLEALRAGRRRAYALAVAGGARVEGTLAAIVALAEERHLPVREVEREELDRLAAGHQGVALEASPYPYEDLDALIARADASALFLLLDLIEDPQNLGTLLRTADAVGVAGVVIPAHRAASVTPAVSNASAGAVEYLPVAQVTNLVQAMEALRAAGIWLAGLEDLPEATLYDQADWSGPTALVVGSEGRGMRRLVRERCDFIVRLPMAGHISSLNAAVAGSIVLYHAWRSREHGG